MDNKQLDLNFELEMKNECINALEDCILKQFEAIELLKKQNNNLKHAFDTLESESMELLKKQNNNLKHAFDTLESDRSSNFGGVDDVKW